MSSLTASFTPASSLSAAEEKGGTATDPLIESTPNTDHGHAVTADGQAPDGWEISSEGTPDTHRAWVLRASP